MYIRVILPAAIWNIYGEHALGYAMAASAGVVKAIVRFYRINSDPDSDSDSKPYTDK